MLFKGSFFLRNPTLLAFLNNFFCTLVVIIAFPNNASANSKCLPYFLYGYNQSFVHFPNSANFCIQSGDGEINIRTDVLGGRVINAISGSKSEKFFFGESQLLGFDISGIPGSHDLNKEFPDKKLIFYGAPNNGPFESLNYANYVLRKKNGGEITIGFNFGADIFRLLPAWNPEHFVPLKSKELDYYLEHRFLYEVKIAIGLIGGKFFTSKRPSKTQLRKLFKDINLDTLNKRIDVYFSNLKNLTARESLTTNMIIYPPYWGYETNADSGSLMADAKTLIHFYNFVCDKIINQPFLTNVMVGKPVLNKPDPLTSDGRHFSRGTLEYIPASQYCASNSRY